MPAFNPGTLSVSSRPTTRASVPGKAPKLQEKPAPPKKRGNKKQINK